MRQMGLLTVPVDDLRGGYRHCLIIHVLNVAREEKSGSVEKKIDLAVEMEVKRGGSIDNILEHGIDEPLTKRDASIKAIPHFLIKIKFLPDLGDIGDPEEADSELGSKSLQEVPVRGFFLHEPILDVVRQAVNGG